MYIYWHQWLGGVNYLKYILRLIKSNMLRYGIGTKCRMESSRSDVWHQSEGRYTLRVMPCRRKATDSMHRTSRGDYIPILRIG